MDTIRVGKVGMPFPVDPEFAREFAEGLDTILVIEEKRSFLEFQLKDALYAMERRPVVHGKDVFPPTGELDPDKIAKVLAQFLHSAFRLPASDFPSSPDSQPHRPAAFCS